MDPNYPYQEQPLERTEEEVDEVLQQEAAAGNNAVEAMRFQEAPIVKETRRPDGTLLRQTRRMANGDLVSVILDPQGRIKHRMRYPA